MYKPNFCCDCGEKIESAKWKLWTTNRFCDDCSTQLDHPLRRLLTPLVGALILAGGAFIAGQSFVEKRPTIIASSNQNPPQSVAAQTNQLPQNAKTAAQQPPSPQTASEAKPQTLVASAATSPPQINVPQTTEETVYYCGARTQKGTLCTRRKRGGGRCWQHEGKPALVAQEKLKITR